MKIYVKTQVTQKLVPRNKWLPCKGDIVISPHGTKGKLCQLPATPAIAALLDHCYSSDKSSVMESKENTTKHTTLRTKKGE